MTAIRVGRAVAAALFAGLVVLTAAPLLSGDTPAQPAGTAGEPLDPPVAGDPLDPPVVGASAGPTAGATPSGPAADRPAQPAVLARLAPPTGNRLVTNEYATYNGAKTESATTSGTGWVANSGSLFSRNGAYWSGVPDSCEPDRDSARCTNSNLFRVYSQERFSGDLAVSLSVRLNRALSGDACDDDDTCWHGVHVWPRYRTEQDLYSVSVRRADGRVVIKRKVPCGSDNGGTYVALSRYTPHEVPAGQWGHYTVTLTDGSDGSVRIRLYDDAATGDTPVVSAVDRGGRNPKWSAGCRIVGRYPDARYPPLRAAGSVGLRGDFADFSFGTVTICARRPCVPPAR